MSERSRPTQTTVTRIESGERAITVAELVQIAGVLNVSPRWLLTESFTGEDVPVIRDIKLALPVARAWLDGDQELTSADAYTFLSVIVPEERARTLFGQARLGIARSADPGN